jgi:hypothetical protein
MATSWADQVMPWNVQVEEITALELWPDATTEVFMVPFQANMTSFAPPVRPPDGSIMVKLLPVEVMGQAVRFSVLTQAPFAVLHESFVQTLLSLQFFGGNVHAPVAALQVSVVQRFVSTHLGGNVQAPVAVLQVSTVQGFVSTHLGEKTHPPVTVLHEPVVQISP